MIGVGRIRMDEYKINIRLTKVGMKLSQSVYDKSQTLLIAKDVELTAKMIMQLKFCGIEEVWVKGKNLGKQWNELEEEVVLPVHIEKIKDTPVFKHFSEAHHEVVESIKEDINGVILNNKEIDVQALIDEINNILSQVTNNIQIFDMLQCIRAYDDSTYIHSVNVGLICNVMGKWLHFNEVDIEVLTVCGVLHDIGKLMMPSNIIKKAGKLTQGEYVTIQTHPYIGYGLLKDKNIDERIKKAVLQHHEKCDGTGYPSGLKREEIEDFAKVVTIADVYDAMTADRVYRQGVCPFDVIDIFEQEGFQKYDPDYLLTFLKHIAESYINKPVQLSDNREGQIIMLNQNKLSRPVVKVGKDYIDLLQEKNLSIAKIL